MTAFIEKKEKNELTFELFQDFSDVALPKMQCIVVNSGMNAKWICICVANVKNVDSRNV